MAACAALAILVAVAASGTFAAPEGWTLLAVVAAGFSLSRGFGRVRLPGPGRTAAGLTSARPPAAGRDLAPEASAALATAAPVPTSAASPAPGRPAAAPARPGAASRPGPTTAAPTQPLPVRPAPVAAQPLGASRAPAAARSAQPDAGDEHTVVLSEERPEVTKRQRPRERVRVRKQIVTEYVTVRVPVRREELVIEPVPIGEAGVLDGPLPDGGHQEIILSGEEPVVGTRIVARERVWLETAIVAQEGTVREEVHRERLSVDSDEGAQR